ncbi:MAG: hypothetical protein AAGB13_03580 [Cyanobacteria bacterium P01_F01_bin.33]
MHEVVWTEGPLLYFHRMQSQSSSASARFQTWEHHLHEILSTHLEPYEFEQWRQHLGQSDSPDIQRAFNSGDSPEEVAYGVLWSFGYHVGLD